MASKRFPGVGASSSSSNMRATFVGALSTDLGAAHAGRCTEILSGRHPALAMAVRTVEFAGEPAEPPALVDFPAEHEELPPLYQALTRNVIQLVVHSAQDLPLELVPGLLLVALGERGDARQALVANGGHASLAELPAGARIGVSSLLLRAQVLAQRDDLEIRAIPLGTESWLRRLDAEKVDAIIVPGAELDQMRLGYRVTERLSTETFLPPAGQGSIAVVVRQRDFGAKTLGMAVSHPHSAMAIDGERAVLAALGGPGHLPIAVHGVVDNGSLHLEAEVFSLDGSQSMRLVQEGFGSVAETVGEELGMAMLEQGVFDLLQASRKELGAS